MKKLFLVVLLAVLALPMFAGTALVGANDQNGVPLTWADGCSATKLNDCVQALEVRDKVSGTFLGEVDSCTTSAGSLCVGLLSRKGAIGNFGDYSVQTRTRYLDQSGSVKFTGWLDNLVTVSGTPTDVKITFAPGGGTVKGQ